MLGWVSPRAISALCHGVKPWVHSRKDKGKRKGAAGTAWGHVGDSKGTLWDEKMARAGNVQRRKKDTGGREKGQVWHRSARLKKGHRDKTGDTGQGGDTWGRVTGEGCFGI